MPQKLKTPEWFIQLDKKYRSGAAHLLIVHGNIYDIVPVDDDFVLCNEFLPSWLSGQHAIVHYDRSQGPRFSRPEHEALFMEVNRYQARGPAQLSRREQAALNALGEPLPSSDVLDKNPTLFLGQMVNFFQHVSKQDPRPVALILEFAETLAPAGALAAMSEEDRDHLVTLLRMATDRAWKAAGHVLVLLCANPADLNEHLLAHQYGAELISIPLPDRELRQAFIEYAQASSSNLLTEIRSEELVHLTAGMSLQQIESLWLEMHHSGRILTPDRIKERKQELLKNELGDLVEILEPRHHMDHLGGMNRIKTFFRNVTKALATGRHLAVPRGMILMGPPGVGKTAMAEAMAHEAGFNFVRIINPREKWVGQSERNFWKVLQTLRSLTPVVVVEDEADQSDASRDHTVADTGVTSRLRQMRFEFTSDPKLQGQVLWLRITNRPDLLDPADVRSGRSSERIPFFIPEIEDMTAILQAIAERLDLLLAEDIDFPHLAEKLGGQFPRQLVGADLEEMTLRAYRRAAFSERNEVTREDFEQAIDDFMPPHSPEFLRNMELLAASQCSSRRFIPARYRSFEASKEQ